MLTEGYWEKITAMILIIPHIIIASVNRSKAFLFSLFFSKIQSIKIIANKSCIRNKEITNVQEATPIRIVICLRLNRLTGILIPELHFIKFAVEKIGRASCRERV